jgi:hypothetical protein
MLSGGSDIPRPSQRVSLEPSQDCARPAGTPSDVRVPRPVSEYWPVILRSPGTAQPSSGQRNADSAPDSEERHHPAISACALPDEVAGIWKQLLRTREQAVTGGDSDGDRSIVTVERTGYRRCLTRCGRST